MAHLARDDHAFVEVKPYSGCALCGRVESAHDRDWIVWWIALLVAMGVGVEIGWVVWGA